MAGKPTLIRKILPFFLLVAIVITAITVSNILNHHDPTPPRPVPPETTYREVETAIEVIEKYSWDANSYNRVTESIHHLSANKIIDEEQQKTLSSHLESVYIGKLNVAVRDFFTNGSSSGMDVMSRELDRYRRNPAYEDQVREMATVVDKYFAFLGYERKIQSMLKIQYSAPLVKQTRADYTSLKSGLYLNQSKHVRAIAEEYDKELNDFVETALDFDVNNISENTDCIEKYSKYEYYLNTCRKRQEENRKSSHPTSPNSGLNK